MPPSALIHTYRYHKRGFGNRDYAGTEEMPLPNLANVLVMSPLLWKIFTTKNYLTLYFSSVFYC
jgi:hypothetical protein